MKRFILSLILVLIASRVANAESWTLEEFEKLYPDFIVTKVAKYSVHFMQAKCSRILPEQSAPLPLEPTVFNGFFFKDSNKNISFATAFHDVEELLKEGYACNYRIAKSLPLKEENNTKPISLNFDKSVSLPKADTLLISPFNAEGAPLELDAIPEIDFFDAVNNQLGRTSEVFSVCRNVFENGKLETRIMLHQYHSAGEISIEEMREGCSGSPVFTLAGRFLGIVHSKSKDRDALFFSYIFPKNKTKFDPITFLLSGDSSCPEFIGENGLFLSYNPDLDTFRLKDYPNNDNLKWLQKYWFNFYGVNGPDELSYTLTQNLGAFRKIQLKFTNELPPPGYERSISVKGVPYSIPIYKLLFKGAKELEENNFWYLINHIQFGRALYNHSDQSEGDPADQDVAFHFDVFRDVNDINGANRLQKVFEGEVGVIYYNNTLNFDDIEATLVLKKYLAEWDLLDMKSEKNGIFTILQQPSKSPFFVDNPAISMEFLLD